MTAIALPSNSGEKKSEISGWVIHLKMK